MSLGPVSTVRGSGRCSQGMEGEPTTQILPKSRASHPLSHVILPTNTSYLILKRCVSYLKKAKWDFCHHSTAAQSGDVQSKHGRFDLLWPRRLILVLTQLPARNWNRRHWSATHEHPVTTPASEYGEARLKTAQATGHLSLLFVVTRAFYAPPETDQLCR